jgi:hypothetical protein
MKVIRAILPLLACITALSCGGAQCEDCAKKPEGDTASTEKTDTEQEKNIEETKKRIRQWLSADIAAKAQALAKKTGKDIGRTLASNPKVLTGVKEFTASVLKDKTVQPRLEDIKSDATRGFTKKLTLGWKALKAGGIDEFKKKVGADAQRMGMEALTERVQKVLLKDERMSSLLKAFSKTFKLQSQIAAIALQENLSAKVTAAIADIALRISVSDDNKDIGTRVNDWISACEDDAFARVESLLEDFIVLPSVQNALQSTVIEILEDERTEKEIVRLINALLDDEKVTAGLTAVYEAAAFEKGDAAIKDAIKEILVLETVDKELFATLTSLASSKETGDLIGKNLKKIGEDPKTAVLIEDFIVSILETCGDPSDN